MEVIKTTETIEKTAFQTSDGKTFSDQTLAEIHEQFLVFEAAADKLPYAEGAYYCATQEDFNLVVDMHAYEHPFYHMSKHTYVPEYGYNKEDFAGSDWYFFHYEYDDNGPDHYWVDTLSERKKEWENFLRPFNEAEKRFTLGTSKTI